MFFRHFYLSLDKCKTIEVFFFYLNSKYLTLTLEKQSLLITTIILIELLIYIYIHKTQSTGLFPREFNLLPVACLQDCVTQSHVTFTLSISGIFLGKS